jgi:ABC-2 type transport system permease protein
VYAYLPANAGKLIMSARQSDDLLSPWQGFAVFCGWTVVLLGAAAFLLNRRDV